MELENTVTFVGISAQIKESCSAPTALTQGSFRITCQTKPWLDFLPPTKKAWPQMSFLTWAHHFFCHIALFISVLLCPSYSPQWGGNQFQCITVKDGSILNMQPEDRGGGGSLEELWVRTHICLGRRRLFFFDKLLNTDSVYTLSSERLIMVYFPRTPVSSSGRSTKKNPVAFTHLTTQTQWCLPTCVPTTGNGGNCKISKIVIHQAAVGI